MWGERLGGFVHLLKCGGMSIRRLVPAHDNLRWMVFRSDWARDHFDEHPEAASTVTFVEDLDDDARARLYPFTFVRNPWARVVSVWQMYEDERRRTRFSGHRTFEELVELVCDPAIGCTRQPGHATLRDWFQSPECIKSHVAPCVDEIRRWTDAGFQFGHLGRCETFAEDWAVVGGALGIVAVLPHENRTAHRHYSSYYRPETQAKIAELLAADIAAFDYRFERP